MAAGVPVIVTGSGSPVCFLQYLVPSLEFELSFVRGNGRMCEVVANMSFMWRAPGNVAGEEGLSPRPDVSNAQPQRSAAETCHGPTFKGSLGICQSV